MTDIEEAALQWIADRINAGQTEEFEGQIARMALRHYRFTSRCKMDHPSWFIPAPFAASDNGAESDIVEYAIRYCVSRNSYAFEDGLDLAEHHWDALAESTKTDVLYGVRHNERIDLCRWPKIAAARFPSRAVRGES